MPTRLLILPGLGDSGPDHWQTLWERQRPEARRVLQRDWNHPDRGEWVEALDSAVAACEEPPVLVCHSLGCLAAVHWAAARKRALRGALLVGPADADSLAASLESRSFRPIPMARLSFASTVVASSDDPYVTLERAREFARAWGSRFENAGPRGHINAAAGLGPWPEGERFLADLLSQGGELGGRISAGATGESPRRV